MLAAGVALVTNGEPYPTTPTTLGLGDFLISATIDRGRADEFSTQRASTASLTLQNRRGDFDATNTTGAFYGHLLGMSQVKINVVHPIRGTNHDVYTGYVETWDYTRQGPRGATTVAALVDMMALLANANVATGTRGAPFGAFYAAQHWDDRIKAALADAEVPSTHFRVATGNINCMGHTYLAGSKALDPILDAVEAEFPGASNCWINPSGIFIASGRKIRGVDGNDPDANPEYEDYVKRWKVGDAGACLVDPTLLPIFDIAWQRGKETLKNRALLTPEGATDGAIDANYVEYRPSVDAYGPWEYAATGLLILDADHDPVSYTKLGGGSITNSGTGLDECRAFGEYLVGNYSDPHDRISSIQFHGQMDDGLTEPGGESGALWDFILGVDINHIIEVTTLNPPGGLLANGTADDSHGGFAATEFFVEGIHHDFSSLNDKIPRWSMNLDLSRRPKTKKIVDGAVMGWDE